MTQVINGFTHPSVIEQQSTGGPPGGDPEEVASQLAGIAGAFAFLAHGCQDTGGPLLWNALPYLSDRLCDVSDQVDALLEGNVCLPPPLRDQLEELAKRENRSFANLVETHLREVVRQAGMEPPADAI